MPVAVQPEKQAAKQPTADHRRQEDHYRHSSHGFAARPGHEKIVFMDTPVANQAGRKVHRAIALFV